MKTLAETSVVKNALARFEKNTKISNHQLNLKHTRVPQSARVTMDIIWTRLHNNDNNEQLNGVTFTKRECDALGLPCGDTSATFYLDRNPINNQRMIVFFDKK